MESHPKSKIIQVLSKVAEDIIPVSNARISSAIVYKGEIISIGCNKKKSDPMQYKFSRNCDKIFLHAEIDSIKKALRYITIDQLTKSSIYVCRMRWENTSRKRMVFGLAKPCIFCMRAIVNFDIKKIYYTTNESIEEINLG